MNRWHAFLQLILSRLREFYREPEAVFWVYGFPLILAIGLGIAFSGGKPEPPKVDIQGNDTDPKALDLAKVLKAHYAGHHRNIPDSHFYPGKRPDLTLTRQRTPQSSKGQAKGAR